RNGARELAGAQHRLHLPVLQPDAGADRGGERGTAAVAREAFAQRAGAACRGCFEAGGAAGPHGPHAAAAFGWPAAARGHRPRHRGRPEDHRRRRAHRRSGPQVRRRGARPAQDPQRVAGQDGGHGHARSPRRRGRQGAPAPGQGTAHMTLTGLALRNAFLRNKTRSTLTVLGVVLSAVAFLFLRTVLTAWYASSEASSADRLVTRNAVSLINPLPLSYAARIQQIPGVTKVTWMNWFGGIYKDRKNFFAQFAIDGPSALDVFGIRF